MDLAAHYLTIKECHTNLTRLFMQLNNLKMSKQDLTIPDNTFSLKEKGFMCQETKKLIKFLIIALLSQIIE